jgi:hypothetical protein
MLSTPVILSFLSVAISIISYFKDSPAEHDEEQLATNEFATMNPQ